MAGARRSSRSPHSHSERLAISGTGTKTPPTSGSSLGAAAPAAQAARRPCGACRSRASRSRRTASRSCPALLVAAGVFLLALNDGTYGVTARSSLAIAAWWTVAIGVVAAAAGRAGALPAEAWVAGGALALLAAFAAASIAWADSAERRLREVDRVLLYLGIFTLVVLMTRRGDAARWSDGIALGITAVGVLALTSELFPGSIGPERAADLLPGREPPQLPAQLLERPRDPRRDRASRCCCARRPPSGPAMGARPGAGADPGAHRRDLPRPPRAAAPRPRSPAWSCSCCSPAAASPRSPPSLVAGLGVVRRGGGAGRPPRAGGRRRSGRRRPPARATARRCCSPCSAWLRARLLRPGALSSRASRSQLRPHRVRRPRGRRRCAVAGGRRRGRRTRCRSSTTSSSCPPAGRRRRHRLHQGAPAERERQRPLADLGSARWTSGRASRSTAAAPARSRRGGPSTARLTKFVRDAHSLYLETLGELGVLGLRAALAAFGAGFVAAGRRLLRAARRASGRRSPRCSARWRRSWSAPASTGCGS